jgi:hypothetical protein
LANFGSVTFTLAQATLDGGAAQDIGAYPNIALVDMVTVNIFGNITAIIASTSPLSATGDSFTVAYGSSAPPAPSLSIRGNGVMVGADGMLNSAAVLLPANGLSFTLGDVFASARQDWLGGPKDLRTNTENLSLRTPSSTEARATAAVFARLGAASGAWHSRVGNHGVGAGFTSASSGLGAGFAVQWVQPGLDTMSHFLRSPGSRGALLKTSLANAGLQADPNLIAALPNGAASGTMHDDTLASAGQAAAPLVLAAAFYQGQALVDEEERDDRRLRRPALRCRRARE